MSRLGKELNLTPKQLDILRRIRDSRTRSGYSPTMQEMADQVGVTKVTVFEHVQALVRKGALIRDQHKARSLRLSDKVQLPDEGDTRRLPLVGRIAAGRPIEAVENPVSLDLGELFGPSSNVNASDLFVLEVVGDSMIDEQIRDGDRVICRRTNHAMNGQTVVALFADGEATLKKFYREMGNRIRLQPANEAYEPIWVPADELQIQGVVVGLIRTC